MIHVCSLNHLHATVASTGAGRIVSLLEGGYALSALARSAAAHVAVLIA